MTITVERMITLTTPPEIKKMDLLEQHCVQVTGPQYTQAHTHTHAYLGKSRRKFIKMLLEKIVFDKFNGLV